jgi:hypothetical protein
MYATPQIKIGQRVDALKIDRAFVREGRRGDDVNALCLLIQLT